MTAPEITIPEEAIERVAKRLALLCEDDEENWEDYTHGVYEICLPLPKEPEA